MARTFSLEAIRALGLAELPEAIGRRAMPAAVELVTAKAREVAPSRHTGPKSLVTNIRGKVLPDGLSGVVQATARHAHLVHDGTMGRGRIVPRHKRAMKIVYRGTVLYRAASTHVGIPANPFLDKARDQSIPAVEGALLAAANAELSEVTA
jgi:hypothetical protein